MRAKFGEQIALTTDAACQSHDLQILSPLHSLRVQSWTAICLLIFFPDESKDSVGDDAYERRDNQYHQELTHNVVLRAQLRSV